MAAKKGKAKATKKSGKRAAATADTASLDQPTSQQNQAAFFKGVIPLDIARSETQTPSATYLDLEDGGRVLVNPLSREVRGTLLCDSECPDGHEEGEVATGTLGKTATCSECGQLMRPKVYVEEGTGRKVELVDAPKRKGADPDDEPRQVARYIKETKSGGARKRGAGSSSDDESESALGARARAGAIDQENAQLAEDQAKTTKAAKSSSSRKGGKKAGAKKAAKKGGARTNAEPKAGAEG